MDPTWLSSMQVVVKDGVNSGLTPDQIGLQQMAWAVNTTIRDGKPRTRTYKLVQRATLPKGLVQGGGYFSRDNGQLIVSIWGQLWRILVTANTVTVDEISLEFRNSALNWQAWMCETVGSFLIQDGESACIIYDGSTTRRADPFKNEVPLGRQMAYGNGRLSIAVNGSQVVVGDITTDTFGSELLFTENVYLNGGGAFLYPTPITALAFLPVNNTFSGYGSLMVFGDKFIDSLHLEITQRDQWAATNGFQVSVLPNIGSVAQDVVVRVNQDLYFRAPDGAVWSVRSAVSDQGTPGNSPLSREISRVVDFETDVSLPMSSGIYFDGRMMWLGSPYNNRFGAPSFKSIISLDASPLQTMRGKAEPAYDGVAEGLSFQRILTGIFNGQQRAFVISTDDDGENRLWEIVPDARADAYFKTTDNVIALTPVPVQSYQETRLMDFGAAAWAGGPVGRDNRLKQLLRCDLWPTQIEGEGNVKVYYRADYRTQWQFWDEFDVCAVMDNANDSWLNLSQQERGLVKTLTAPKAVSSQSSLDANVGFEFQVRVVVTGQLMINRIKLFARPVDEVAYANRQDTKQACIQNSIANNEIVYSIPVGGLGSSYTDQANAVYVDGYGIPYTKEIS